jgi:hypothetical protein
VKFPNAEIASKCTKEQLNFLNFPDFLPRAPTEERMEGWGKCRRRENYCGISGKGKGRRSDREKRRDTMIMNGLKRASALGTNRRTDLDN